MPNSRPQAPDAKREPVPTPGADATFADKLNYLFDRLRPRDGDPKKINPDTGEFQNAYVAKTVSTYGDGTLSATYVATLRERGENPSIRVARLLAKFFDVPAGYFVEDEVTERIVKQFSFVQRLSEQGVKNIAMRAADLSPASQEAVLQMVEVARNMEGLPSTAAPRP
ncbi:MULTISPECIES: hypothetical protein [unclassified Streptomyces]|uniref:hypothetical protein n=1 Tax=unclassified Streptomyces TaxID=2593676 RepID=UPI0035DC5DF6